MDTSRRVGVVGAGLAGLSAARELADRGVAVTLFEARERVGGRIRSLTLENGAVVELGAEWIMDDDDAVFALARRFGLTPVETGTDYKRREAWGDVEASPQAQDDFLAAANEVRAAVPPADVAAMTLGDLIDAVPGDEAARHVLRMRLQGTCAVDLYRVALRIVDAELAFSPRTARYHRLGGGNQGLAEATAASLDDVRLQSPVDAVIHGRRGATVRAGSHEEHVDAVVVAVPAPLVTAIRFEPSLPDVLTTALARLPMGVASKLAVATRGRPTNRSRQSTQTSMWCWTANGEDGTPRECVTSFAGSPAAQRELGVDPDRAAVWLEAVRRMNPDLSLEGEPVVHAWAEDAYARGSYSAWDNPSWDRLHDGVFTLMVDRVAFAGEHTAGAEHYATMNGALLSGRRAAEQVLRALA